MNHKVVVLIAAVSILIPWRVSAYELDTQSRTYFQVRENAADDTLMPLHEYLDFHADGLADNRVSFHFGAWVRQDLNDNESFDDLSSDGDLQYAYLSFYDRKRTAFLNLGRLAVFEGIAADLVDGAHIGFRLGGGFGASAYGGVPVETDFDDQSDDSLYGGRLYHEVPDVSIVGASYLKETNDGEDFREEGAFDIWIMPFQGLEVSGRSTYNYETEDWMEHSYFLTLGPFNILRLGGEATWISYDDYFNNTGSPAFAFRPGVLDPDEEVVILGGNAELEFVTHASLTGDYKNYDYDNADSADYYGGALKYFNPDTWGAGLYIHRMEGGLDLHRYNEYRVFLYKKLSDRADVTLDGYNVQYDEKINNVEHSYTFAAALGMDTTNNSRFAVDVSYSENPDFDEDFRAFIKFILGYSTHSGR